MFGSPSSPSSRKDLEPKVWGEWFWMSMYSVAHSYPITANSKDIKAAKDFYTSLQYLLPCGACRDEYTKVLKNIPLGHNLRTQKDLFLWVNRIHNTINVTLNRDKVSIDEIINKLHTIHTIHTRTDILNTSVQQSKQINIKKEVKKEVKIPQPSRVPISYNNSAHSTRVPRGGCKSCGK